MDDTDPEQCDNCGFNGARFANDELLTALDALAERWRLALLDAGSLLRTRPGPEVWSAIEYAAHSRDITALHRYGVGEALSGTEPDFGDIASDDLINNAVSTYERADPEEVVRVLGAEATATASLARGAPYEQWTRGLRVGGERMTVRRLLEHALHDSTHHLIDIERNLATLRAVED